MAIERIEKSEPAPYRVQPSGEGKQRQKQPSPEEKEKDQFEKKPSLWRRVLFMGNEPRRTSPLLTGKPQNLRLRAGPEEEGSDESSLTFSERILVLWGILGRDGHPRPGVILTYAIVVGMILGATFLIIGMTLWR